MKPTIHDWFRRMWIEHRLRYACALERGDDTEAEALRRRMNMLADSFTLDQREIPV